MPTCLIRVLIASLLLAFIGALNTFGADTPEFWASRTKDGDQQNSNARSLQGALTVRWTLNQRNLDVTNYNYDEPYCYGGSGWSEARRSYGVSVRNGRILLVIGSTAPITLGGDTYTTYGTYSLANGSLLSSCVTPMLVPTGMGGGFNLSQYWKSDGTVYTLNGGDESCNARFNPYTGEVPIGLASCNNLYTGDASWTQHRVDSDDKFAMSNSNPLIFGIGEAGPSTSVTNGLLDTGSATVIIPGSDVTVACNNPYLVSGNFAYEISALNAAGANYSGIQITGYELLSGPPFSSRTCWNYADAAKGPVSLSSPPFNRACCIAADGRIYYYGCNFTTTAAGPAVNWPLGVFLAGVRTADGVCDAYIPVNYDMSQDGWRGANTNTHAQLATLGNQVVVFQPQLTPPVSGHVFCFNTDNQALAWRHDFAPGYFDPVNSNSFVGAYPPRMTIAGDSAYIVAAKGGAGYLTLQVERLSLATGADTTTVLTPLDSNGQPITVVNSTTVVMRDVAAVDGALVCMVDYDANYSVLTVIQGNATPAYSFPPVAVISAPVTGAPMLQQRHYSDYPAPTTNQFDCGAPIAFSSAGSFDPGGGALTYRWDFGDGSTSALANPTHTYASLGSAPAVANRTATLTVTNTAGNSAAATRVLAIRDVGSLQTLVYTAVADSYVLSTTGNTNTNFGAAAQMLVNGDVFTERGYLRFDLMSAPPTNIVSATLRLWIEPQSFGSNELYVSQCANTWAENTITWNNAPAPGAVVGAKMLPATLLYNGFYVDVPVTQYVQGAGSDGQLSFTLDLSEQVYARLYVGTKEGGMPAQLILQVGAPGYTAPYIVTQPAATAGNNLSILGGSVFGEAALSYNWCVVSGGAATFTPNNTNSAKLTSLTSTGGAGPFVVQCVVFDGMQSIVSNPVSVGGAQSAPLIYSASSASGAVGAAFSYTIAATNSPTSYGAAGLPAGLHLSGNVISGTPTAAGVASVTLTATNASGASAPTTLALTVNGAAPPVIASAPAANGVVGAAFNYTIVASNNPVSYSATGLPAGLHLGGNVIYGTPTAAGTASIVVGAANTGGSGSATLTLTVVMPAQPAINSALVDTATVGMAYSYAIDATNSPESFNATGLPAGLTVNAATGVISGTPTAAGTATVTLSATNAGGTGVASLTLTMNATLPAPVITSPLTASGAVGTPFTYVISASNAPIVFTATNLPAGLSVNALNGVISGTPTAAGTSSVPLSAINSSGTGNATLVLTISGTLPPAPVINSALTASGTVGTAFSYTITASNSPASFNATGLPAGLSVNTSTGVISGTPTTAGTSSVTLSATNAGGTGSATLVLTISGALPPAPIINSALTASGTVGTAFSYTITASNSPASFNATGLPAGLSVNTSTGVISGTPTTAGTSSVALSATNAGGTGHATLSLTVNPAAPVINSALTASGTVGTAFSYTITASNSPTSFNATGLPAGLSVNTSTGVISGTPTTAGTSSVALSATNAGGTGHATLSLTVNPAAPVINSALTASGTVGTAFSYTITASNSPTSFNATGLPAGLSVNTSTGVISGMPTTAGTSSVTLSATNAGGTGHATLSLTVNPAAPVINSALTASGTVGTAFSYTITASNSPTSFNATGLPAGLSVNTSTGVISGTPTTAGTSSVTLSATNAGGTSAPATLVLTVSSSGASGTLTAWGANNYGQLGDGTTTERDSPINVPGLSGVTAVACGAYHTLALMSDGTVKAWGDNRYDQLGTGGGSSLTPVTVPGLSGVQAIAAGGYHSLAVLSDGTVRAWGYNGKGEIGDGTTTSRSTPVVVPGLTNVKSVAGGWYHSVAILNDGTAKSWGNNSNGQLGDGTTTNRLSPVTVPGISGATTVGAGLLHTVAVLSSGSMQSWGSNEYGQLGDGTTTDRWSPVAVTGMSGAKGIACGEYHTIVLMNDGTVQGFGYNGYGNLGDGTQTQRTTPVAAVGVSGAVCVAAAYQSTLAVLSDGTVKTWGFNGDGELGDGKTQNWRSIAATVSGLTGMSAASGGAGQVAGVK